MANYGKQGTNEKNPFFDDLNDDIDDSTFLSHPQQGSTGYMLGSENGKSSSTREWEIQRQRMFDERRKIENRTLESSKIALGLLYESEKVGITTAEELVEQREKLENVEGRLDYINSTMRVSQKHLNSMKSIFGGIKNYFSKSKEQPTFLLPSSSSDNSMNLKSNSLSNPSSLEATLGTIKEKATASSVANHPALANHPNFGEDDDEDYLIKRENKSGPINRSSQVDKQLDSNLSELDNGLGRLKSLALGLGDEIEVQNDMIGRIGVKADRAHDTIGYQNRQMRQILKN